MDEGKIYFKNAQSITARVLAVLAFVFALVFLWSCIRLQIGNMFAELTSPNEPGANETALLAKMLAPSDPLANWLVAATERRPVGIEQSDALVSGYIDVVRLSPNDFRWWNELARAREQAEDFAGAEAAFKRMLALAPAYTYPRWQFANFLLRRGKSEEAFSELKKTAESDTVYRDQAYSLVWDYFDNDVARVNEVAGDSASAKISLTKFFALHQQPEESLRIWKSLSEEEKKENAPLARIVAQGLFERKYFRPAVEFVHDLGIEPDANFEMIANGGFENPIGGKEYIFFGWHVLSIEKTDVKLDSRQKYSGNRSLRLLFNGYAKPDFGNVYSVTAVEPNSRYRLSFWLKTENLKSAGPPTVEVINANYDKLITATKPFPVGTADWQAINLDFATPENAQGILIRTSRAFCGEDCPIVGTIWYDDFLLERQK